MLSHLLLVAALTGALSGFLLNPDIFKPDTFQPIPPVYEFDFTLTWELSMLFTDQFDVKWNVTMEDGKLYYYPDGIRIELDPADVVTLDGFQTKYIAINGQYPGPTIEVPLGAEVYVHVHNDMLSDSATLHWHGLTMKDNQWSDGSPYVSQCPILPHTSYTYRFKADDEGVFWYHSHMDMQRMDGLFGAVVVRDSAKPCLPSFMVQVNDWLHVDSSTYTASLIGEGPTTPYYKPNLDRFDHLSDAAVEDLPHDAFLINGKGRFEDNNTPLTIHHVQSNDEYIFMFINTGFDNVLEVSIDNHKMEMVATDSCEVEPVVVDSVFIIVGERATVKVKADQPAGNYWVRYRAPHKAQTNLGYSILSYTNSTQDPATSAKSCVKDDPCVAVNCPFVTPANWTCIPIHELKAVQAYSQEISKMRTPLPDEEYFLAYSYMAGDTINGRALHLPTSPMYQKNYKKAGIECTNSLCQPDGCKCTNVQKLKRDSVVQLIVTHRVLKHFIHSWHMHGYRFAVVKVVYPPVDSNGYITTSPDITCANDLCYDARWANSSLINLTFDRPPLKDTVLIPNGGYTVVRLYTDNPGYWMGHCHQTEHLHEGMAMIFDVDGDSVKKDIPPGFPTCGSFTLNSRV